ncbi:MAG: sulfatase-like hydrolase/transferase [Planctomycetaceae bacterium]|nr:sulfatase-like hydrolase/transferase [Planctomycetaceae bacterium]
MADDIGYECFGCYGSEQYQTPHIDRLASRGMRFEHCYSQPLCTPSRVKLMTGLSNIRNYSAFSVLNSDQKTIGHYFQETGYDTFIGGKWQLLGAEHYPEQFRLKGSWPTETGFDHCCLWQVDKLGDRYWNPLLFLDGNNKQFPPNDYGPDIVTDHILDFIQEERESPFFVYYPMILVHNPFLTTPDSETKSRETKSRETKNRKNQQQNFEDMVAYMDHLVGRIVEQIEKQGIAEETVILFTGDNGTNKAITSQLNGRTIVGGKGKTTDAGTRVALVATHSGSIPEGKVCEDLVDFSDFLPTLMDYAGLPIPDGLDGVSFAPQLKGDPGRPREWIFCYYNPRPERTKPVRFVRDQRWKLYGDGKFFDVSNDPLEEHPVDERPDAYRKLKQALDTMPSESTTLLKFAQ